MAQLYIEENKSQEAEKIIRRIFEIDPPNQAIYLELGDYLKPIRRSQDAGEALKEESSLAVKIYIQHSGRLAAYKKATIDNYQRLREIVLQKGIKLIVVQYPCRSIEPLKNIFKNKDGIIFVDNENTFKDALRQGNYSEYFNDRFAGDFGHCTRRGNRLLAENVANAILRIGN